ncbi:hypothetical protein [Sphingomonas sp. 28-62-11]|uniref:hypothetical protein n=1 Tax=Sphingomonas sp. 28-62-11 TaxID=1970432 RepID=UPI000BD7C298|nr:MAG: hypothetical protein B7Y49_14205 [Sphingomonas sp. 28-62-11]
MTAGYSGTPLIKKLGFKAGMVVWFDASMPAQIKAEIAPEANGIGVLSLPVQGMEAAQIFVTERAALMSAITTIRPLLTPSGFLWVSWPKKASKVATDLTEDVIRECALPTGFVDVKVCAVDATWSGLKLMIRRELR